MLVKNKISGIIYEKLIMYASKKTDAVMFVFRKDGFDELQKQETDYHSASLKKQLSGLLLKRRNGSQWVFSKVGYSQLGITELSDPPGFDDLFEILFFKMSLRTTKYLLNNKNLYAWLNPDYPEDISFFKDGYCWLYSIAHENLCDIYCESKEEYEYLKSIGIEFWNDEFVPISEDEIYYENY